MTLRLAVMLCTLIMVAPALSLASSRPLLTSRGDSHAQASTSSRHEGVAIAETGSPQEAGVS